MCVGGGGGGGGGGGAGCIIGGVSDLYNIRRMWVDYLVSCWPSAKKDFVQLRLMCKAQCCKSNPR